MKKISIIAGTYDQARYLLNFDPDYNFENSFSRWYLCSICKLFRQAAALVLKARRHSAKSL